jgi:signal transduction histidine kinase
MGLHFWIILLLSIGFLIPMGLFLYFFKKYKQKVRETTTLHTELDIAQKEIKSLLGVVNHDLKSPFNQMFGLTSLLKMSNNLTEEHLEYLGKMDLVVRGGLRMMRNLLDLRAFDQGRLKVGRGKLKPADLLPDLKRSLTPYAQGHEVELTWPEVVPDTFFWGDKDALNKVMENIIGNAIRFTKEGGKVHVAILEKEDRMVWEVKDNGPGIPANDLPLLWERYRVLTNKPGGGETAVGIGLSIAHQLASAMQATIRVETEVEKGSIFSVELSTKG